jgi:tetrapyrrole methylase family protein/MazG family protein
MATVIVVGLGPADVEHLSARTRRLLEEASTVRLRTHRHPAAAAFPGVESFDALYEHAGSFDTLYASIADELAALAKADPGGTVVYAVPGSPLVCERTVALLRARDDVDVVVEPAVSFVDLACAALGIDPVAVGLTLADALDLPERLRGPGPVLFAQAHSREALDGIALRVEVDLDDGPIEAVVLHHLGLDDQRIEVMEVARLGSFDAPDHLTSVYLGALRTGGVAIEDLLVLMDTLRARCPWDEVQTHGSLSRYLVEESYEALDALEGLARALDAEASAMAGPPDRGEVVVRDAAAHAAEELGDLLFQIVFHARLGSEEGLFDLRAIADGVRVKLIGRHPHVFGDAVASTPDAVAARWEELKQEEKGRTSVTDGIPASLPALSMMAKVRRKALAIGIAMPDRGSIDVSVRDALASVPDPSSLPDDASIGADPGATAAIGMALESLCDLARLVGVDPEQALRDRARALIERIKASEVAAGYRGGPGTASSVVASEVSRSDKE